MIRKCTDEDISDEELEKVINPFYDNYHKYIITYVMPEVIAFYIASSFSRNAMWEATFYQHYNSAKDIFNVSDDEDYEKVKAEVIKLLRMKYSLEIISEDLFSKKLTENIFLCECMWAVGVEKIIFLDYLPSGGTSNNSYNSSFVIIPFSACS